MIMQQQKKYCWQLGENSMNAVFMLIKQYI